MSPSIPDILKHYDYDPTRIERVGKRPFEKLPLRIEAPNPAWPQHFETLRALIDKALGSAALSINHVGSTAVPNLPAKAVIDIDLTFPDPSAEDAYVPALESVGFVFLTREPTWHEHRFFNTNKPYHCNLHVFAHGTAELVRHQIMKEWLIANEDDRDLYARTKSRAMEESILLGETVMQYNARKQKVVREVLERAFKARGFLPPEADKN
ncbi:hypothetical protein KVR01_006861 [Diaporthe batatas]|uniref:uncharacterized protein n=1 Tax=Diaporthe batatas TaxID=748121 RepID=UPI001D037957|nr:uncharacterized protein KVR01_006861 [Diaporthe batatas]KAG8163564.1 hypothetical protein KVR01_006861 [Diaporthe batatas]